MPKTRQGDYIWLARDREDRALAKMQNMPWAEPETSLALPWWLALAIPAIIVGGWIAWL